MCYFSSAKFFRFFNKSLSFAAFNIPSFLFLAAFPIGSVAEPLPATQSDTKPLLAQYYQAAAENTILPSTSDPLPPALPNRIPPAIPMMQATIPNSFTQTKASLAWRQKAHNISAEKFKPSNPDTSKNPLLRPFFANYSDTLMALAASCPSAGFKVEYLNSNAGELLAQNNDGQARLIFVVWEQPEGKTWISAAVDRGNASALTKSALLILDTTGNTVSKRGRI